MIPALTGWLALQTGRQKMRSWGRGCDDTILSTASYVLSAVVRVWQRSHLLPPPLARGQGHTQTGLVCLPFLENMGDRLLGTFNHKLDDSKAQYGAYYLWVVV